MMTTALICLATAIYHEARGEPIDGQMMVAEVILNRTDDPRWPDTVCDVVKEPHQFSFYRDGLSNTPNDTEAYSTALIVAAEAMAGEHLWAGPLYYHTTAVRPVWRHALEPLGIVGDHIFYTDTNDCRLPTCSMRPAMRPEN